jgi:hypothetical protein
LTSTDASVPLVWKLTSSSVPASTLPVPVTVDWTTPSSAVKTSRELRAELPGGPISSTASTIAPAAKSTSTYRYQG